MARRKIEEFDPSSVKTVDSQALLASGNPFDWEIAARLFPVQLSPEQVRRLAAERPTFADNGVRDFLHEHGQVLKDAECHVLVTLVTAVRGRILATLDSLQADAKAVVPKGDGRYETSTLVNGVPEVVAELESLSRSYGDLAEGKYAHYVREIVAKGEKGGALTDLEHPWLYDLAKRGFMGKSLPRAVDEFKEAFSGNGTYGVERAKSNLRELEKALEDCRGVHGFKKWEHLVSIFTQSSPSSVGKTERVRASVLKLAEKAIPLICVDPNEVARQLTVSDRHVGVTRGVLEALSSLRAALIRHKEKLNDPSYGDLGDFLSDLERGVRVVQNFMPSAVATGRSAA